jgi:hypothetical protein
MIWTLVHVDSKSLPESVSQAVQFPFPHHSAVLLPESLPGHLSLSHFALSLALTRTLSLILSLSELFIIVHTRCACSTPTPAVSRVAGEGRRLDIERGALQDSHLYFHVFGQPPA